MKFSKMTMHSITFCAIIALFAAMTSCSKDDDNNAKDPVDQLPPATQTGENTIGCLVNGEAFLPKGISPSGNRQCFYQLVDGEYYFGLSFFNKKQDSMKSVGVTLQKIEITGNTTFVLDNNYTNNPEIPWGGGHIRFIQMFYKNLNILLQRENLKAN